MSMQKEQEVIPLMTPMRAIVQAVVTVQVTVRAAVHLVAAMEGVVQEVVDLPLSSLLSEASLYKTILTTDSSLPM